MLRALAYRIPPVRRLYERIDRLAAEVEELKRVVLDYDALVALVAEQANTLLPRAALEAELSMRDQLMRAGLGREIDPELYLALENRFRGESSAVGDRLQVYLPFVEPLGRGPYPLVDLGAGRGEWVRLMADHGINAYGVDDNAAMVAEARDAGTDVREENLLTFLERAPDQSVGALTLFHVVEHLPFMAIVEVFREAARVLVPGGLLIVETPNAANVGVGASTFWVDPTHVRPLYPPVLEFLADECGYARVQYLFLHPALVLPPPSDLSSAEEDPIARLWEAVFGPQDLGFVTWTRA